MRNPQPSDLDEAEYLDGIGAQGPLRLTELAVGEPLVIVSLEAIFLSTFVMISQNRTDAKRQVIADEEWNMVQDEDTRWQRRLEALMKRQRE